MKLFAGNLIKYETPIEIIPMKLVFKNSVKWVEENEMLDVTLKIAAF